MQAELRLCAKLDLMAMGLCPQNLDWISAVKFVELTSFLKVEEVLHSFSYTNIPVISLMQRILTFI